MRVWYIGCALAFQASEVSSSLITRFASNKKHQWAHGEMDITRSFYLLVSGSTPDVPAFKNIL